MEKVSERALNSGAVLENQIGKEFYPGCKENSGMRGDCVSMKQDGGCEGEKTSA